MSDSLPALRATAKSYFDGATSPAHDWHHVQRGEVIHDPALPPAADDTPAGATQYNHFHRKILDLPDRMYTDAGREIATERSAFVESFLERFEQEVAGER